MDLALYRSLRTRQFLIRPVCGRAANIRAGPNSRDPTLGKRPSNRAFFFCSCFNSDDRFYILIVQVSIFSCCRGCGPPCYNNFPSAPGSVVLNQKKSTSRIPSFIIKLSRYAILFISEYPLDLHQAVFHPLPPRGVSIQPDPRFSWLIKQKRKARDLMRHHQRHPLSSSLQHLCKISPAGRPRRAEPRCGWVH